MIIVNTTEHLCIYGCHVVYDMAAGTYKTWLGGNELSASSRGDIAFKIMCAQSHPTI